MLYPPIHELKKNVNSKYLVVTMAAKRARQMLEEPNVMALDSYDSFKDVGRALEEIAEKKVTVKK